MDLIKLYTFHGPVYVDVIDLISTRTLLPIYTSRGNKLCDTATGQKNMKAGISNMVHRDNLFASLELATQNMERIHSDIRNHGTPMSRIFGCCKD